MSTVKIWQLVMNGEYSRISGQYQQTVQDLREEVEDYRDNSGDEDLDYFSIGGIAL